MSEVIVWKVLWSSNGYRGWDDRVYREFFLGGRAGGLGFKFFAEYGFGFEWWNFYEGFSDDFYFGYAPPVHAMRPRKFRSGGLVFFISRSAIGNWYVVGVYGDCVISDEPFDVGLNLWDTVDEKYKGHILDVTRRELMSSNPFYLRASKKCSTVMPIPFGIDLQQDLGVKPLRQAFFTYIDLDRAESFLYKLIGRVDSLSGVGDYWCSVDDCLRRLRFLLEEVIPRLRRGQVRPTGLTVEHPHVVKVVEYPQERVVEIPESLVEKSDCS